MNVLIGTFKELEKLPNRSESDISKKNCLNISIKKSYVRHTMQKKLIALFKPQSCGGIEFAHSIFRHYRPEVLSFREAMQLGLINHGLAYEE